MAKSIAVAVRSYLHTDEPPRYFAGISKGRRLLWRSEETYPDEETAKTAALYYLTCKARGTC